MATPVQLSELLECAGSYRFSASHQALCDRLCLDFCNNGFCLLDLKMDKVGALLAAHQCMPLGAQLPGGGLTPATAGALSYRSLGGRSQVWQLRLGAVDPHTLPPFMTAWAAGAFDTLDVVARVVLGALARSSGLGGQASSYYTLLDDKPLPSPNAASASFLHLMHHQAGAPDLSPRVERGVLAVVSTQQHGLQVQDSSQRWVDVQLGRPNTVALLPGYCLEWATNGLLRAARFREVTPAHLSQTPRTTLVFTLCGRPQALVDYSQLLGQLQQVHSMTAAHTAGPLRYPPRTCGQIQQLTPDATSANRTSATANGSAAAATAAAAAAAPLAHQPPGPSSTTQEAPGHPTSLEALAAACRAAGAAASPMSGLDSSGAGGVPSSKRVKIEEGAAGTNQAPSILAPHAAAAADQAPATAPRSDDASADTATAAAATAAGNPGSATATGGAAAAAAAGDKPWISICAVTPKGVRCWFRVLPTTVIANVKQAYWRSQAPAANGAHIKFFRDLQLMDLERTVAEYGLADGDTITVVLDADGGP